MATRIIALANQKGGVGKTTTTVNLAAALAEKGRRILVVDFDAQANATSGLGLEKTEGQSLYGVLLGEGKAEDFIKTTAVRRLDIIPAEVNLAGAEIDVARLDRYLHRLSDALAPIVASDRYDLIFVDCPPSLGVLTMNALTAADAIVLPIQCEYYALEGLSVMIRLVEQVRLGGANPRLQIEGIVMTMFDQRTNLSNQVVQQVVEHFSDKVYETVIPRSVRVSEAPSYGQPVLVYDRHCTGTAAYRALAKEFMKRERTRAGMPEPAEPESAPEPVDPEPTPETKPATEPPAS
jgi:chromosome partitioning protein